MRAARSYIQRCLQGGELVGADLVSGDQIAESRERVLRRLDGRDRGASILLGGLFLAAAASTLLFLPSERSFSAGTAAVLVAAYLLVSRVEFEIGPATVVPTQVVFVPMLFLLPLPSVPLVAALCYVLGGVLDRLSGIGHLERTVVGLTSAWFALGPVLVLGLGLAGEARPAWSDWPLYLAALGAQFLFDFLGTAVRGWLAFGIRPVEQLLSLGWAALLDATLAPVGLLAAVASMTERFAFLLVLPVVGLMAIFARERKIRIDHALELGRAYRGTAMLLGDVVEADDAYTGAHSRDVVSLVLAVCRRLGIRARETRRAEFVALLHDVGKIRIPAEIINKPGPLTADERALIETHTIEGERLLAGIGGLLGEIGRAVRSCHEHFDGKGYPDRLAGAEIPLVARVVACCDAFSAMTTDRPYRRGLPTATVLAELRTHAGTQFDPQVVDALVEVIEADEVERDQAVARGLTRDHRVVVAASGSR